LAPPENVVPTSDPDFSRNNVLWDSAPSGPDKLYSVVSCFVAELREKIVPDPLAPSPAELVP